jgi:uncharacterized phage-like protein YoqJ
LTELAMAVIRRYKPEMVISGMALGWDQALAKAAVNLEVPFIAAIPFPGQERRWPADSQAQYQRLLDQAAQICVISEHTDPSDWRSVSRAMQLRNEWMVDSCQVLAALWSGKRKGGTWNCLRYARRVSKERPELRITQCWEAWTTRYCR